MSQTGSPLDELCINAIRALSIDAIQKANSGHPGLPLGAAPMAYVLWQHHLQHAPHQPAWPNRDRFTLSAGHGSMLLYSLLHLTGYDLSIDDIKAFRQWESKTPGHPESFMTPGVEATTGPLGQGTANAVGMAIAERMLAHAYNRPGYALVDHMSYALVSDGDLMEGISAEAASLAGHLKLGKLVYLYDANDISLDGPTSLAFTEDVGMRYTACGWQVLTVEDGDRDLNALDQAIAEAKKDTARPSLIIVKTTIGFGSPNKAGSEAAHGSPLGEEEVALTKAQLGWHEEPFTTAAEADAELRKAVGNGQALVQAWDEMFMAYQRDYPEMAAQWQMAHTGRLPEGWDGQFPEFSGSIATRSASGKVLNAVAGQVPWLTGGDADLSCSTKTAISGGGSFEGTSGSGRNIHFGVREHAMGAIANGMAYHGGLRAYTATFACFADYMRPAMRLAALSELPCLYIFTHDSIGLGEDGPTHQPVEHLASLRAMPNMLVIRPADACETAEAWRISMTHNSGPVSFFLSRQNLPVFNKAQQERAKNARRGAYILEDAANGEPQVTLIATGSEVSLALNAREALEKDGVATRVVSMPCWKLFASQDAAYRDSVLPPGGARVAIEAASSFGWERWTGSNGKIIGLSQFGASAPGSEILERMGFSTANICSTAKSLI